MTPHILDRPVWNALTTRQAYLALGKGMDAVRYPPDIEPFGAARDNAPDQLLALGRLTPLDGGVALVEPHKVVPPPGLIVLFEEPVWQMVAARIPAPEDHSGVLALKDADAPQMQALAELTQPGPFHARTHTLGDFVGMRENGKLIAMAGERMRVPGFTSAVCTHPDARGRGLAAKLMRIVADKIAARGEQLFLHVYPHNKAAIAVYEKLGFRHRADVQLTVLRHRQPGEA